MAVKRVPRKAVLPKLNYMRGVNRKIPANLLRPLAKLSRFGLNSLTEVECCRLVFWQLKRTAEWEQLVWDKIWGGGGGGTPPPPPKWPPA